MDPILIVVIVIVALLLGTGLGWFLGAKPVADWKERAGAHDDKVKDLVRDLATMSERAERADGLAGDLDKARGETAARVGELAEQGAQLATLKANAANFDEQKRALIETKENLLKEFQLTGARVLDEAQEKFAKKATEQFGHSEKANEAKIKALLDPVGQRLKSYEDQVQSLEKQRIDAFGSLRSQIDEMQKGQLAVQAEAMKLSSALTSGPKARGNWGEQQLKNLLEQCGLSQHTDFLLEHSVETDEGRLRPDAIVRIPGGKMLVIDSKVSLNAYQEAVSADNEEERSAAMNAHVASMKTHIQQLGAKSYQSQFEEAPDYVVMFVPGEHFVAAALDHEPELWNYAFDRKVLLATPTNLVALARTVAQVWRQDALADEAREIGRIGGEIYDRLAKVTEDIGKIGTHLGRAVNSYNDFNRSFETRVLVSARKLKEKGIEIGKREIEDVPLVEASPRHTSEDIQQAVSTPLVEGS